MVNTKLKIFGLYLSLLVAWKEEGCADSYGGMEICLFNIVLGSRKELPSGIRSSGLPMSTEEQGQDFNLKPVFSVAIAT